METTLSPVVGFTMKKRARVTIKTPVLPSGTLGVDVYLAKGTATPSRTVASMTAQGSTTGSPPSKLVKTASFTPLNNPTVNGFGSGVAAKITSDDGTSINLAADGAWSLAGLGSHVPGGTSTTLYDSGWQTWTLGTGDAPFGGTVGYCQWRRVGSNMYLRAQRVTNASFTGNADGNYANANLNNAANIYPPTNPDQNVICAARWDDVPVSIVLTTGGNLTVTGGPGGSRVFASGSTIQLTTSFPT